MFVEIQTRERDHRSPNLPKHNCSSNKNREEFAPTRLKDRAGTAFISRLSSWRDHVNEDRGVTVRTAGSTVVLPRSTGLVFSTCARSTLRPHRQMFPKPLFLDAKKNAHNELLSHDVGEYCDVFEQLPLYATYDAFDLFYW